MWSAVRTRTHPAYLLALVLVLVAALAWPVVRHAQAQRESRLTARMWSLGERVSDPGGLTLKRRGQCPDTTHLVRCLHSPDDAEAVSQHYLRALTRVAGQAGQSCSTLTSRSVTTRHCLVRMDVGKHAVLISVDSGVRLNGDHLELDGAEIRIDAI
jgi:hypothetical protein